MFRKKADLSEELFRKGYKLWRKEDPDAIVSDRLFVKPLEKATKLKNPKAAFVLGYILVTGYKDLGVDLKKGNRLLRRCFEPLKSLSDDNKDYLATRFLSEYYKVPLGGHIKDDAKAQDLLSLSEAYRDAELLPAEDDAFPGSPASPLPEHGGQKVGKDESSADDKADTTVYDQLVHAISMLKDDSSYDNAETISMISGFADRGNIRAAVFLGDAYSEGQYVPKDADAARSYYLKAEELGSVKAKFRLGQEAVEGNFSRQNVVKGLNRIYQAAKAGLPEAQFFLGVIYYEGKYLDKDLSKAYLYFQAAMTRGYSEADPYLMSIESKQGDKRLINSD